jgi:hypothetical protein
VKQMNKKILVWLILFFPVGLFLFIKKQMSSSTSPATANKSESEITPQSEIEEQHPKPKKEPTNPSKHKEQKISFFHSNSRASKIVRFCLKALIWFAPYYMVMKFSIIPALGGIEAEGTEDVLQIVSLIYFCGIIPSFYFPKHRKKILIGFVVFGLLGLLGEFGPDPETMESLWFQIPFYVVGLIVWFVGMGLISTYSKNPELKEYAKGRLLTKSEVKLFTIPVIICLIALLVSGLGVVIWFFKDSILEQLSMWGALVGFVMIVIGNLILGHPDARFTTGYKGNIEPNVMIGLPCLILGVPLLLYGLLS